LPVTPRAYGKICNPGDCQNLEDLVAQKHRELRPRCKCTAETQCSFLPIENERPEQTVVPPKSFRIVTVSTVKFACKHRRRHHNPCSELIRIWLT
jgi:hypothetical protein